MNQNHKQQSAHRSGDMNPSHSVDAEDMKDSVEFGGGTEWDALTNTLSWDAESALILGSEPTHEPFMHYSLSPSASLTATAATSPMLGNHSEPGSFFPEGPLSPTHLPLSVWQHYPLLGVNAEDLMKLHERQVAAKRERRKVQNRKAQQAYRERREQQVEMLKGRISAAEKQCQNQAHTIRNLKVDLTKLKDERETLLRELRRPTFPASIPSTSSGSSLETVEMDQDDLLAYSSARRFSL